MPHLVVLYTGNLEVHADVGGLCRALADTLLAQRDEAGAPVFPRGGTRVLAYPSAHHAVSDGGEAGRAAGEDGDYGFVYLNLRMGRGRSDAVKKRVGDALVDAAKASMSTLLAQRRVGVTLQIDESPGQVFDAKFGNLHELFGK
jgi:5-carboxymethyl-2-hydroxymuconate isomerase